MTSSSSTCLVHSGDASYALFNCESFGKFLDVGTSLHQYLLSFTSKCHRMAIATGKHLIMTDDVQFYKDTPGAYNSEECDGATIETVFEFNDDAGTPTVLRWITDDCVCCGFSSGDFVCFDCDGVGLIEQRCDESPVASIRVSESQLIPSSNGVAVMCVWILHESGILAVVPIDNLVNGHVDDLIRLKSLNQSSVGDLILLPHVISHSISAVATSMTAPTGKPDSSHSILLGGANPCIALYNLGGKQHFEHFGKLAGYYTSKVGGYLTRTMSALFGSSSTKTKDAKCAAQSMEAIPMSSILDFQDAKRKILRLSLDPSAKFVAASDNMGRVLLYDLLINSIIRLWKGVRGARIAWSQSLLEESDQRAERESAADGNASLHGVNKAALCIAIYAPRTGMLNLYALRNGSCLRSIPVGLYCQVFTLLVPCASAFSYGGDKRASCCLVRSSGKGSVEIVVIDPYGGEAQTESGASKPQSLHSPLNRLDREKIPSDTSSPDSASSPRCEQQHEISQDPLEVIDTVISVLKSIREMKRELLGALLEEYEHQFGIAVAKISSAITALKILMHVQFVELGAAMFYPSLASTTRTGSATPTSPPRSQFLRLKRGAPVLPLLSSVPCPTDSSTSKYFALPPPPLGGRERAYSFPLFVHVALTDMLERIATNTNPSVSIRESDRRLFLLEARARRQLITAYDTLKSLTAAGNGTVMATAAHHSSSVPLVASISRQNGRGEALSWVLRKLRLQAKDSDDAGLQIATGAGSARSPSTASSISASYQHSPNIRSAVLLHSNLCRDETALSHAVRTRSNSNISISSDSSSVRSPTGSFIPALSVGRTGSFSSSISRGASFDDAVPPDQGMSADSTPASFSLFRAFHSVQSVNVADDIDSVSVSFLADSLLRAAAATKPHAVLHPDALALLPHTLSAKLIEGSLPTSTECIVIPARSAISLLSVIVSPLVGDAFSLPSSTAAWRQMGLSRMRGLSSLLQCLYSLLSVRPLGHIVTAVLLRAAATCPLQRWLRDELIALYEAYTLLIGKASIKPNNEASSRDGQFVASLQDADRVELEALIAETQKLNAVIFTECGGDSLRPSRPVSTLSAALGRAPDNAPADTFPSFDEIVRHIFRPVWIDVRASSSLEIALSFSSVLSESLGDIDEYAGKKSYGLQHAIKSKLAWENLCRMLRVALLISARNLCTGITVRDLATSQRNELGMDFGPESRTSRGSGRTDVEVAAKDGSSGIFKILAEDTLSFATQVEHALAHEQRCYETVYRTGSAVAPSPSATGADNLLQAWGTRSDKRWRDLLALCENDDAADAVVVPSPKSSKTADPPPKLRRRRPLLLLFPHHVAMAVPLASYRAFSLAEKFRQRISRSHSLGLCSAHLFTLPPLARATVTARILSQTVLPIVLQLAVLEDNPLSPIQFPQNQGIDISEMVALLNGGQSEFVKATTEMLSYIDFALPSASSSVLTGGVFAEIPSRLVAFHDEVPRPVWPPTDDAVLQSLLSQFSELIATPDNSIALRRRARDYTSLLLVLSLRLSCSLRGVRVSALFPPEFFKVLLEDRTALRVEWHSGNDESPSEAIRALLSCRGSPMRGRETHTTITPSTLTATRLEFLQLCLSAYISESQNQSGLSAATSPIGVYRLAELLELDLEGIRMMHAETLCRAGTDDEEVSYLISQLHVDRRAAIVDCITRQLRTRLRRRVLPLRDVPAFGHIMATVPPLNWEYLEPTAASDDSSLDQTRGKNNIASARHLLLGLQTMCNKEKSTGDEWQLRRRRVESLLDVTIALVKAGNKGLLPL